MGVTREMGFTRFVQNGRICLCNYGPDEGKLVMIVDVIDDKRCLCYAPDMARKVMTYKCLSLTDIVVPIARAPRKKTADAAWAAAGVEAQWAATSWGKKFAARKAKATATDFERFQQMCAKKKLNAAARAKVSK